MDESLKKEILRRFEKLPRDIQQVILSSDFPSKIEEIRKKHNLTDEQAADLNNESTFVMIGLERPADFVDNIQDALKLSQESANAIAIEVNEMVFKEIRESLKRIHEAAGNLSSTEMGLNKHDFTPPPPPSAKSFVPSRAAAPENLPTESPPVRPWEKSGAVDTGFVEKQAETPPPPPQPVPQPQPETAQKNLADKPATQTAVSPPAWSNPDAAMPPPPVFKQPDAVIKKDATEKEFTSETAPFNPPPKPPPFALADKLPEKNKLEGAPQTPAVPPSPPRSASPPAFAPRPTPPPAPTKIQPDETDKDRDIQNGGGSIIEQKLSSATSLPRDEKRYIVDPYREPIG